MPRHLIKEFQGALLSAQTTTAAREYADRNSMVVRPSMLMWINVTSLSGCMVAVHLVRDFHMSAIIKLEMISRRKALSLLGLTAVGLAGVPVLTVSVADAQTAGMERRDERRKGRQDRRDERRTGRTERREERRTGTTTGRHDYRRRHRNKYHHRHRYSKVIPPTWRIEPLERGHPSSGFFHWVVLVVEHWFRVAPMIDDTILIVMVTFAVGFAWLWFIAQKKKRKRKESLQQKEVE